MRKFLILSLTVLTGCYSYVPAAQQVLARGTPVRARLSTPTDFRLTEISVNNAVTVQGEVVRQDADSLIVSAVSLRSETGREVPAAGETLAIPSARIAGVEKKRFDVLRSVAVTAAGFATTLLLFMAFDAGGGSGGPGGGGPSPQ